MPEGVTESAAPKAKPIRRRARQGGRSTASVAPEPATHSLTVTMMSRDIHSAARTLEGLRDESRTEALKALLEEVKRRRNPQKPILMMGRAIEEELGDDLASQVAVDFYGRLGGELSSLWTRLLGGIFGGGFRRLEKPAEIQLPTALLLDAIVALTR